VWLALRAVDVGYLLMWLGHSLGAVVWLRQSARAGAWPPSRTVVSLEVLDDPPTSDLGVVNIGSPPWVTQPQ
jgi:hypothetical protein